MTHREDEFTHRLARAQDAAIDATAIQASVRDRLVVGARPRAQRSERGLVFAGAALAVAAAAALAALYPSGPRELTARQGDAPLQVGAWIDASDGEARLDFSDGTVIRLDAGSTARLAALDSKGAHLVLERGTVDLDVVHTGHAAWQVQAGPFAVAVTGTSFETTWTPESDSFALQMRTGSVWVTGPGLGQGKAVSGTEALTFDLSEQRGAIALRPTAEVPVEPVADAGPARAPAVPRAPGVADEAPADWWSAVVEHDYALALDRAKQGGLAEIYEGAPADHLLGLADAAGQVGDNGVQARAYGQVRARFAGSEEAATAALLLGRVALDRTRDPDAAASWFRTAYDESSVAGTRQNALGLNMLALEQAGESKAAKQAAIEYLEAYPDGLHAQRAQALAPRKR